MLNFFDGEWRATGAELPVHNPFDGSLVDTVPRASVSDLERAIAALEAGARVMRSLTAHERSTILRRAAEIMLRREEDGNYRNNTFLQLAGALFKL